MFFSFNFVWDSIQLGLVREEQGNEEGGGGEGDGVYVTDKIC